MSLAHRRLALKAVSWSAFGLIFSRFCTDPSRRMVSDPGDPPSSHGEQGVLLALGASLWPLFHVCHWLFDRPSPTPPEHVEKPLPYLRKALLRAGLSTLVLGLFAVLALSYAVAALALALLAANAGSLSVQELIGPVLGAIVSLLTVLTLTSSASHLRCQVGLRGTGLHGVAAKPVHKYL